MIPSELKAARAEVTQAGFRLLNATVEPAVRSGIANPPPLGPGAVVLETIGRVSKKTRRVPLLASRLGDKLVLSTVRSDSQWLKNVEAEPAVLVWLHGKSRPATASVLRGPLNLVFLTLTSEP